MNKKKVLYFEGAGMEGTKRNDIDNCRIRTAFKTDDGRRAYYVELSGNEITKYHKKYDFYKDFKIGSAVLSVSYCHEITEDPEIDDANESRVNLTEGYGLLSYDSKTILDLINERFGTDFSEIKVLPWLSGYSVHAKNGGYNFMDDFVDIPARTKERRRIYKEVAKEHFAEIYKSNVKENPRYGRLLKDNASHSVLSMDDKSITIRSYTYKELIKEEQRVKKFEVNY